MSISLWGNSWQMMRNNNNIIVLNTVYIYEGGQHMFRDYGGHISPCAYIKCSLVCQFVKFQYMPDCHYSIIYAINHMITDFTLFLILLLTQCKYDLSTVLQQTERQWYMRPPCMHLTISMLLCSPSRSG